jgi:hypothetical protein
VPVSTLGWSTFAANTPFGHAGLVRDGSVGFFLAVSQWSETSPLHLSIGGVNVGDFSIPTAVPGSDGSLLEVGLSESVLDQILATNDGASTLDFQFTLASGDWFRIATVDDLDLDPSFNLINYGTGLEAVGGPAVPEPGSIVLLALGGIIVTVCYGASRSLGSRRS